MNLNEFTAENVRPHIGTKFHAVIDDQPLELVLEKVNVLMEQHVQPHLKRDTFSLLFSGPKDLFIKQGPYEMTHEELGGPWLIFIVPVTRYDDGRFQFEAVFT